MIRRPPRSTRKESSAASDVYKRQEKTPDFVQIQEHLLKEILYYLMVVQVKSMVMVVLKHLLTKMVAVEVQVLVELNRMVVMEFKLI